jgi:hypothetical protein
MVVYPTPDEKQRSIVPIVISLKESGIAVPILIPGKPLPQKRPATNVWVMDKHCYVVEDEAVTKASQVHRGGNRQDAP